MCGEGLSEKQGTIKENVDLIDGLCLAALVCTIYYSLPQ